MTQEAGDGSAKLHLVLSCDRALSKCQVLCWAPECKGEQTPSLPSGRLESSAIHGRGGGVPR